MRSTELTQPLGKTRGFANVPRIFGTKRSQVQILSPRLFSKSGRSAKTSNGFLFVVTRLTSLKVRFKQTESRISRRIALFEPRQISAARCDQSKIVRAVSPDRDPVSPN